MGKNGGLKAFGSSGLGLSGRVLEGARPPREIARARPIAIVVEDPRWIDEAKLIAVATSRPFAVLRDLKELVDQRRWGRNGVILLTDREISPGELAGLAEASDMCVAVPMTVLRIDEYMRDFAGEATMELVARIGVHDPLRIAVVGAHGGAGTSVFSAGLGSVLEEILCQDVLLVDRDPHSQGLATVLGVENQPGWSSVDPDAETTEGDLLQNCAQLGEISVLGRMSRLRGCYEGQQVDELSVAGLDRIARRTHLIVDCGRMFPDGDEWDEQWGDCVFDAIVLVGAINISGLVAVRDLAEMCRGITDVPVMQVLRRTPDGGCSSGMALALLGGKPDVTWDYDPDLTYSLDRGMLDVRNSKLAKAARTIVVDIIAQLIDGAANLDGGRAG